MNKFKVVRRQEIIDGELKKDVLYIYNTDETGYSSGLYCIHTNDIEEFIQSVKSALTTKIAEE